MGHWVYLQAFSSNGRPTIETVDSANQHLIGNRYGHSFRDIKLANIIYSCNCEYSSLLLCQGERTKFDRFVDLNVRCAQRRVYSDPRIYCN